MTENSYKNTQKWITQNIQRKNIFKNSSRNHSTQIQSINKHSKKWKKQLKNHSKNSVKKNSLQKILVKEISQIQSIRNITKIFNKTIQ